MREYRYVNYPQMMKEHPDNFGLILFYDPQGPQQGIGKTPSPPEAAETAPSIFDDVIWVRLPVSFELMTASQIQILTTEGFGTLCVNTSIERHKLQKMKIQSGTSYLETVDKQDLDLLHDWCDRVFHSF